MSTTKTSLEIPQLLSQSIVFQESFIGIQRDIIQSASAKPYAYYSLITPPTAVVILPITAHGEYIFNEEYRHPTKKILLGCPGGFIDNNESPLAAAQRELLEETGFKAKSFQLIGSAFPYSGFSMQKTFYVLALDAYVYGEQFLETSEIIRPIVYSRQMLLEAIQNGIELDGTLCTALFFHQIHQDLPHNDS